MSAPDSTSRLLNTLLAAISASEQRHRENTRKGIDRARKRGAQLGRPRSPDAPDPRTVYVLRTKKRMSWQAIAGELESDRVKVRRAFARYLRKAPR